MTPILIVATPDSTDSLAAAFEAGCDDFIPKPVQQSVLDARLTAHLERSGLYRQLERMHRTLNRYVSPRTRQMAEQYACSGALPPPHQVEVCVLFTDIRGFTQLSQDLDPERLFSLLSRQLALQVDLVYEHGGYVDKYAGDGIMAVFEGEDRAERACRCALDIIANARSADSASLGSVFAVGCGLHDGRAVIGNIGSRDHLDYSVIGGTVNLAARLCGFSDRLAVTVSESVRNAVPAEARLNFSTARAVDVKGFREPVVVYRLQPES
jgi:adenylate cyclase